MRSAKLYWIDNFHLYVCNKWDDIKITITMHFEGEIHKLWMQITQVTNMTRRLCFPMYWMTHSGQKPIMVFEVLRVPRRQTRMMPSLVTECESVNKTQQGYCRRLLFCCSSKIYEVWYLIAIWNTTHYGCNTDRTVRVFLHTVQIKIVKKHSIHIILLF